MHELAHASRILVYGVTGSGKSTLAARLGVLTGLPVHLADELFWRPGWVMAPSGEQRAGIERFCATDRWILDTAYSGWRDVALARAELVIGLDYPRWLSLFRLLRRTVLRVATGRQVCNGNRESLRTLLSRDSILLWHFRSFARKRRRIREWQARGDGPAVRVFRSPRGLDAWLQDFADRRQTAADPPTDE